jgi:hypothetical protein
MTYENKSKEELDKLMRERAKKAEHIIKFSKDIQASEHQVVDLSQVGREILKFPIPSGIDWDTQIKYWQQSNDQANKVLDQINPSGVFVLSSGTSGLTYGMMPFLKFDYSHLPQKQEKEAISAQEHLRIIIYNPQHKEIVIDLMKKFGLETGASGKKSAIQQFEAAWACYETPATPGEPVNTSLIPMREAIQTIIDALLNSRPSQEEAKNRHDKIISIGNQLAQEGIAKTTIGDWALKWGELADKLSGSKQAEMTRTEWQHLLLQATLFIKELLLGLDVSKLRKK